MSQEPTPAHSPWWSSKAFWSGIVAAGLGIGPLLDALKIADIPMPQGVKAGLAIASLVTAFVITPALNAWRSELGIKNLQGGGE